MRKSVSQLLESCGYQFVTTCDSVEALRIMRTWPVATRLGWTTDTMVWMDLMAAASATLTELATRGNSRRGVGGSSEVQAQGRRKKSAVAGQFTES
jgi:CheY-like chemotaxis protein